MPMNNMKKHDEVRTIILSLCLARPNATPVAVLDQDYFEMEGKHIPYREFGYADMVEFLKSMPEYFQVEWSNGCHYVNGIPSEKSKHVSSLVARQKSDLRLRRPPRFRQVPRVTHVQHARQRIRIPAEHLFFLTQYIKNNPHGVSMQNALSLIQKNLPHITLSIQDMREQIRELSHQLYLDYDMIYPVSNETAGATKNYQAHNQEPHSSVAVSKLQNASRSPVATETVYVGGDEGSEYMEDFDDDSDYVPAGCISRNSRRQLKTSERIVANLAQCREQNTTLNYNNNNDIDVDEYFNSANNVSNDETTSVGMNDISSLITDKVKSRLKQLMQKHPQGIWCADLPEKYLKEYKVHLNYNELGFNSMREYVSYLPSIFFMMQTDTCDDYILYSADQRPIIPDKEISRTKPIEIRPASRERHDEHNAVRTCGDDDAPIPAEASPTITKKFAPDDAMNYEDSVNKILVTELQRNKKYLEVYVEEIFHPNFFWIHLRENKRRFDIFMEELEIFYCNNKEKYIIPKIALKKGLNCACVYSGSWHRGIIKTVKPDFKVTVLFYDYGTLKTYTSEDVYYLHKQFSFLPMQAIPCGLYNVIPCVSDRWKKSVINKFSDKVTDTLLAATIVSVDSTHNSMVVILTDTSEEEDVCINNWLVKEKLARYGKMVRMCDNFSDMHCNSEYNCTVRQSPMFVKTSDMERVISKDETRHDREQSMPRDEKVHTLFDAKDEDVKKINIKDLNNVPSHKRSFILQVRNIKSANTKSPNVKSLDTKSQSRNYSENESRESRKLNSFLKAWNATSDSNSSICTSIVSEDFKNNAQQIDSDTKVDAEPQNSTGDLNHWLSEMNFSMRDSDNEDINEKDFGTFRSLYGGHGHMEPFDWSLIKKDDYSPRKMATTHKNLDTLIKEHKNDIVKDKSKLHNQRDESSTKPYFLNVTRKEEEYYLPERNIDYENKNVSQSVARLRSRMEVYNNKYTTVTVTRDMLETLRNSVQVQDTPISDANTVRINGTIFSEKMTAQGIINGNYETYETQADQKTERSRDSDIDLKLVSSNTTNNKNRKSRKTFEYNTDNSSESSTTDKKNKKIFCSRLKKFLEQTRHMQMHLTDSVSTNGKESSPSSEEIQSSSCSLSRTTDDMMISSDDERSEKVHFNKSCSFTKLTSASSNDIALNSDYEGTKPLLSSENDSIFSSNTDDSQQNKLNAIAETSCSSKMLQLVLKTVQKMKDNNDLDSDDLSNRESESVKSETSSKKENNKLIDKSINCVSVIHESMSNNANISKETFIFNDCDIESDDDSEWDVCVEPEHISSFITSC